MGWYERSYRKLFFDFHSSQYAHDLAKGFDAETWAQRLQDAHVQAVSVFVKCGCGWSFGRRGSIRYVHPHLPEGMDMVASQLEALHRRGMRGIGYYHIFHSEPVAAEHPEWVECDLDGKPRGYEMCIFSPVLEAWVLPSVAELITEYDLDGIFFDMTFAFRACGCPNCRERFTRENGGLAFPSGPADVNWPRYVAWRLATYETVRQAIAAEVHKHRPDMNLSFNWAYSIREPELVGDGIDSLMADIHPQDQCFNASYMARYWRTLGRPFDLMSSAFLQWWGDWGCKPACAMQQEAATIIANGGLTWIGYQMNAHYGIEQAVMDELGKTMAFVEAREPLLIGAEAVPSVAVLRSTRSNLCIDRPNWFADENTPRGLHRALTESGIPYLTLHEAELLRRLEAFQVVILADQRYLPPELVSALEAWVADGGVLICTALTGTTSPDNRSLNCFALEGLLGMQYVARYEQPHVYLRLTDARLAAGTLDMAHLLECPAVLARPVADDVEVLAELDRIYLRDDGEFLLRWSPVGAPSGFPGITVRRVGKGHAAYVAAEIFHAYQVKNQWNMKHVAANLIRLLAPRLPIEIKAPAWLEVVHTRQEALGRELVHLINSHGNRPVDGNGVCIEQVLPVCGVTVRLRRRERPKRVTSEPSGEALGWTWDEGIVTIQVPQVDIHLAICVS